MPEQTQLAGSFRKYRVLSIEISNEQRSQAARPLPSP
jgi:hypothetical protein